VQRTRVVSWLALLCVVLMGSAALIGYLRWHSRAVVTAAVPAGLHSVVTTLEADLSVRLMAAVAEARDQLDLPAVQVAVVKGGDVVWTGAVGWVDPPAGRAVTVADRFHIGSVSKLYTAALILRLSEEGLLSLDDPVSRFVADVPNGDRITVRQLLNHTSGLANYTESMAFNLQTVLLRRRWPPWRRRPSGPGPSPPAPATSPGSPTPCSPGTSWTRPAAGRC